MLLCVCEVGVVPVAVGVAVPLQVTVPRMMVVVMMVMVGGPLLYLLVALSHRHVDGRPGGLRSPSWGSVLGVLPGEGLELCERDDGGRSRRLRSAWVMWSGVKQGGLRLLPPVLKRLSLLGVDRECGLREVAGMTLGSRDRHWSAASLASLIGSVDDRLCLPARALRRRLDRRRSVLLSHVCLWKVIRISQSSRVGCPRCSRSLLCHGSL